MSPTLRRWGVPLGVAVAVLGLGVGATALRGAGAPALAPRSAAQLLVDLQTAQLEGLSGTVVQRADLGLPAIPLGQGNGAASEHLSSLINGSHTLRVWYAGPDKVRIALLGKVGESDIIRNGRDLWLWSSDDQGASHRTLPEGFAALRPDRLLPMTPQEAADRLLALLEPSTVVSTAGTDRVAGRPVYELVLAPRDGASLVSDVRLAVDAEKHVPLRVRLNAKGGATPAFEIGFTQVSFERPGDEHFRFAPPPGTRVEEEGKPAEPAAPADKGRKPRDPAVTPPKDDNTKDNNSNDNSKVLGSGWTSVLVTRVPADANDPGLAVFLNALPRVSGDWGSGRMLRSRVVTALLTDDGRLLVGAVTPERLYATAKDPAAALK